MSQGGQIQQQEQDDCGFLWGQVSTLVLEVLLEAYSLHLSYNISIAAHGNWVLWCWEGNKLRENWEDIAMEEITQLI